MNLDLQDKVVVITGPAKGMGRAITLAFAREGARLVLAGRDLDAIAPVAREVTELGSEVEVVRCDMTRSTDAEALAAAALNCFGRIDVLVNVAGGSGPIEQIDEIRIMGREDELRSGGHRLEFRPQLSTQSSVKSVFRLFN